MKDYFKNRISTIQFNEEVSKYYNVPTGIGQGSALGPLLFSLYINDISLVIDCKYIMYADDIVLFLSGSDVDQLIEEMNQLLLKLNLWCNDAGLTNSIDKFKYMIMHKPHDSKFLVSKLVAINNVSLERVYVFKYLGIIIDASLSFKHHVAHVQNKLSSPKGRLYSIKRLVNDNVLKLLLNAYVITL